MVTEIIKLKKTSSTGDIETFSRYYYESITAYDSNNVPFPAYMTCLSHYIASISGVANERVAYIVTDITLGEQAHNKEVIDRMIESFSDVNLDEYERVE